jgi:hypothetical protein
MPSASASASRARNLGGSRTGRRAQSASAAALPRVRWDRVGRLALLLVLVALVYLYFSAGLHMLSTWQQSRHDSAVVAGMEREHRQLTRQHEALSGQAALEADARQLGMMYKGEQPYIVGGLPGN